MQEWGLLWPLASCWLEISSFPIVKSFITAPNPPLLCFKISKHLSCYLAESVKLCHICQPWQKKQRSTYASSLTPWTDSAGGFSCQRRATDSRLNTNKNQILLRIYKLNSHICTLPSFDPCSSFSAVSCHADVFSNPRKPLEVRSSKKTDNQRRKDIVTNGFSILTEIENR